MESRPGARVDAVPVPRASGGQPAGLGDADAGGEHAGRPGVAPRLREAPARRAAASHLALRPCPREGPSVLRGERARLHGPALPPQRRGVLVLPAAQDAGRPVMGRRNRTAATGRWRCRPAIRRRPCARASGRRLPPSAEPDRPHQGDGSPHRGSDRRRQDDRCGR